MIQEETENKNPSESIKEIEILNNLKTIRFNSTDMFYEIFTEMLVFNLCVHYSQI